MSPILISITRLLGTDTVQFNTEAHTTASALDIVRQLTSDEVTRSPELDQATDKVIADAKKPAAKKEAAPAAKKPEETTTEAKPVDGPVSSEPAAAIDYDQVKAKVLALAQSKGRDPLVALLQRHGAAKAPDLKPVQYAAFLADIDAINAGTYDPIAAETEAA